MQRQGFPHVFHSSRHLTLHLDSLSSFWTGYVHSRLGCRLPNCLLRIFLWFLLHALRNPPHCSPHLSRHRSFVSVLYTFSLCEHRPSYSTEWRQRSSSSNLTPRRPLRQQQAWQSVANAILWEDMEPVAKGYSILFLLLYCHFFSVFMSILFILDGILFSRYFFSFIPTAKRLSKRLVS